MKKFIRWAVCLGLCLGLLVCGALAAESGISVQLDGQNLTFTDAVPQVKDQRTFLPFRAVFEAMDADVDYEGNTITAVRGDKTLTMTIGSTEASITENGVVMPITMDVAPYVDNTVWRTYVPVRFAAQAFDCAVGWDQAAQTAVIVDTEKLVKESMAGKNFTYLEKIAAMGEKYNTGIWNMDATFDADLSMFTIPLVTLDGAVNGTMKDSAQMDMTMNMKMDMDALIAMVGSMGGTQPSAEELAQFEALKTDGVDLAIRGDLNTGKIYMNMDLSALGVAASESGLDPNTWYELDMAVFMEQAGMKWDDLMTMSKNADMMDALISSLSAAEPNDAANGYNELKKSFEELFAAFADDSFQAGEDGFLSNYFSLEEADSTLTVSLSFQLENDKLTNYAVEAVIEQIQEDTPSVLSLFCVVDADDTQYAQLDMDIGGMMTMSMSVDGSYVPGTAAPVVTPPAGAKVVPFTELAGQTGDLGVIGGQDGPTSIFVSNPAA